jgi:6-phosphogluconolactonase (cycloisomerase 2 family)
MRKPPAPSCVEVSSCLFRIIRRLRVAAALIACASAAASVRAQSVQYAYTANADPPGTISGFVKNSATGALLQISGSPFTEHLAPQQVAMDPGGKFLYVLNPSTNNISMFRIDASTGALTEATNSPFSVGRGTNPQAIAIGGGGKYIFVGNSTSSSTPPFPNDGSIDIYSVDTASPALVTVTSVDTASPVAALATDPNGKNLYALLSTAALVAYSIDPGSGLLIPIGTVSAGDTGHSLAMDAQARWLFAGSGQTSGQLTSFPILPADGSLQAASASSLLLGAGNSPLTMAEDASGEYLYVAAGNAIRIFSVDAKSGALKETSASPVAASVTPTAIAADPQGAFVYAVIAGGLHGFAITDPVTGALGEISGGPITPASSTAGVVIGHTGGQAISGPFAEFVPGSVSLGSWTIGTTSNTSILQVVNTGGQAMNINAISIIGPNAADFKESNTCGPQIASSANCSVSITFTPNNTGIRSAAISFSDNAPGTPQMVSLTGTGLAPQPDVTLIPGSLTFPALVTNLTSQAQSIQVKNSGTGTLHVAKISFDGTNPGDFTETDACSSVGVGLSCNINVTFTPKAAGPRNATLTIQDDAAGSPQTASVTGTGSNPFNIGPSGTNPTSVTVNAGQTAQYNLQAAPGPGYSGTITVSCTGAPTAATCQLSATTLQVNTANPAPIGVSIPTTARNAIAPPAAPIAWPPAGRLLPLYLLLLLLAILWGAIARAGKARAFAPRLAWGRPLAFLILFAALSVAAGCGGGITTTVPPPPPPPPTGTPAGTYTITVTGTSGNFSQQVNLTLIVN